MRYLETNNILGTNQHGFRKQRSCLTQLIAYTNFVHDHIANNVQVDAIYLDYAKAFDKIDHCFLLQKLRQYGFPKAYVKWIESFLTGRKQFVYLNGANSYYTNVVSGVPQGSVLGPLLFIIYINDLPKKISHSTLWTFADDTKVVLPIRDSNDCNKLQDELNSIITWSNSNNMKLNDSKFELVCYGQDNNSNIKLLKSLPFNSIFNEYSLSNQTKLTSSQFVRDLGVLVDAKLDWSVHINHLCSCARKLTAWILNIFYTRDKGVGSLISSTN